MPRTERPVRRAISTVAGIAFAVVVLTTGSADATPTVEHQAWARTGPVAPLAPATGSIYVSVFGGEEQARSYVSIDPTTVDTASLPSASIVLAPGPDGVAVDQAALAACALVVPLTVSGEVTGQPPEADCTVRATLTRAADGSWSLPLEVFASRWSDGAPAGVAIIADLGDTPTLFTVSFDASRTSLVVPSTTAPSPTVPSGDAPPPPTKRSTTGAIPAPGSTPRPIPPVVSVDPGPASAPSPAAAPATSSVPLAAGSTSPPVVLAASRPPAVVVLLPVLAAGALLWARRRRTASDLVGALPVARSRRAAEAAAWVAVPLALSLLSETTIYKLGIVAIVFIAAIGLHLLVNWCGELSLAHAAFIGLPAFAVAQLGARSGWSPLIGLPLAVLVGVSLGSIVAIAALRARGLQVALVTLAVGIATGQFLFFQTWIVGPPEGLQVPAPSFVGIQLTSSRALLPVLAATVLLAVLAARAIMGSTIGRSFLHVRAEPDAAAAAGVPVARQRALAYAIAGGFAGLAGWTYVIWVQQVNAKAFPLQLGFTYLVIAALAGAGGLGGVAIAALVIQGGSLFSILPPTAALYVAPVALILNVTRYPAGFNGLLRAAATAITKRRGALMSDERTDLSPTSTAPQPLRPTAAAGILAVVAGFSAIGLAWYHMGNTDQTWIQNQELLSGGVTGLGLIVLGSALLIRDALLVRPVIGRHVDVAVTRATVEPAPNGQRSPRVSPLVAKSRT